MSAGLRRVVKPTIEMMGAFPTVVIGLIAGIWLAPVIERYLAGILLLPLLLALAIYCVVGAALACRPRHNGHYLRAGM